MTGDATTARGAGDAVRGEPASPTWILLRGLTREAGHWGDFGQRLASLLGGPGRVLVLDLPGNGMRHLEASPLDVPAMAAACRLELVRRGLAPPYALVAMSLGAMVALQWCHEAPGEVTGCVLINTSLRGLTPFWQRLRPASYGPLCRLLWPGLPGPRREAIVLALTSSAPERHPQVAARWADIARQRPVTRHNALRQLIAAARYAPPAVRPPVRLLIVASAADGLVSPRCSERLASGWGLPLKVHSSAGHDLPLDDPDWLLEQVEAWWNGSQGGEQDRL